MTTTRELEITTSGSARFSWRSDTIRSIEDMVGSDNRDLYLLFIESYISLLSDSPFDTTKTPHEFSRFFKLLKKTEPRKLILEYASLADSIIQSMDSTSDYTITGEFIDGMKNTPIFREYLYFFNTGDARALQYILSFLYFGKKMDYIDADLELTAFRSWVEIERAMDAFSISDDITSALRIIIRQLIPDIDDSIFLPRHGPGYTSEGFIDPNDKLDNLSLDEKAVRVFRPTSFGRHCSDRSSLSPFLEKSRKKQVARLKFVPKNVKTMRSICMEPIGRMYLQQEVARWLVGSIHRYSLGSIVDLRDQEYNRQYAYHASYTQSCDTIDLSAASDRIHVQLIRKIFPSKVLYYLLGTRTQYVDTSEGEFVLNKFAPMGSALCFPVQCITFSAITLLGYLMQHYGCRPQDSPSKDWYWLHHIDDFIHQMSTEPEQISKNLLCPRVYGDDIISDRRTTDYILVLLARSGLEVNLDKSFIGGTPFRESCGIFAYNGEDVTPFLFRIPSFRRDKLTPKLYASMISSINRAGDYHYRHLHSLWINRLKKFRVGKIKRNITASIPFTTDPSDFGIFTTTPRNPSVTRYNSEFQRDEKRTLLIRSRSRKRHVSTHAETYAYDQWMRARVRGGSDEMNFSSSRIRPSESRFEWGWTPIR